MQMGRINVLLMLVIGEEAHLASLGWI